MVTIQIRKTIHEGFSMPFPIPKTNPAGCGATFVVLKTNTARCRADNLKKKRHKEL